MKDPGQERATRCRPRTRSRTHGAILVAFERDEGRCEVCLCNGSRHRMAEEGGNAMGAPTRGGPEPGGLKEKGRGLINRRRWLI